MQDVNRKTVVQAARGDIEAFENIYNTFSRFVFNVALRVVNDTDEAEEVTQDVFLAIYRKLPGFEFKSSLKTWVYRITVNRAINHAKKRSKERERMVPYEDTMELSTPANPVNERIERQDQEKIISKLLDSLNPDQRLCLVLRDFEGLSYEEISEVLQVNINTVRTRLKRGREKLMGLSKEVVKNEM